MKDIRNLFSKKNYKIDCVVGIDFGTTHSCVKVFRVQYEDKRISLEKSKEVGVYFNNVSDLNGRFIDTVVYQDTNNCFTIVPPNQYVTKYQHLKLEIRGAVQELKKELRKKEQGISVESIMKGKICYGSNNNEVGSQYLIEVFLTELLKQAYVNKETIQEEIKDTDLQSKNMITLFDYLRDKRFRVVVGYPHMEDDVDEIGVKAYYENSIVPTIRKSFEDNLFPKGRKNNIESILLVEESILAMEVKVQQDWENKTAVLYDCGGGTTDVAAVDIINQNNFVFKTTAGVCYAGADITAELFLYLADNIKVFNVNGNEQKKDEVRIKEILYEKFLDEEIEFEGQANLKYAFEELKKLLTLKKLPTEDGLSIENIYKAQKWRFEDECKQATFSCQVRWRGRYNWTIQGSIDCSKKVKLNDFKDTHRMKMLLEKLIEPLDIVLEKMNNEGKKIGYIVVTGGTSYFTPLQELINKYGSPEIQ